MYAGSSLCQFYFALGIMIWTCVCMFVYDRDAYCTYFCRLNGSVAVKDIVPDDFDAIKVDTCIYKHVYIIKKILFSSLFSVL